MTGVPVTALRDDTRHAMGRLTQAWGWLGEARTPTTHRGTLTTTPTRGGGAGADAARPTPITTRQHIALLLRDLSDNALTPTTGHNPLVGLPDPAARTHTTGCAWCGGGGLLTPTPTMATPWPHPGGVMCPRCHGTGQIPTPTMCPVCGTTGRCHCDWADAVVHTVLTRLGRLLTLIHDGGDGDRNWLAYALRILTTADTMARRAAGAVEHQEPVPASCPACHRRQLHLDTTPGAWLIHCTHPTCVCAGTGCPCHRPIQIPGRRHRWPAREWPTLATRLGVTLPTPDTT